MTCRVLFWYEQATRGLRYDLLDRCITYFRCEPAIIDLVGDFKRAPGRFPLVFESLDQALSEMADFSWVFLHPGAKQVLDELDHPAGDVVYAVGSNHTGLGKSVSELATRGSVVRLRPPEEINDYQVIQFLLYDRFLHQNGRRL